MNNGVMKNVLLIGNLWPYVFGAARFHGLVQHLHTYGWNPIVVTYPLSGVQEDAHYQIVEVPFRGDIFEIWRKLLRRCVRTPDGKGLTFGISEKLGPKTAKGVLARRLFILYQEIFGYPDTERGWRKPATRAADLVVAEKKIDAIISNYPMISHIVARDVAIKHRIPWIADFPDLWSENHNYLFGKLRRAADRRLEKSVLRLANVLTTLSKPWAEKLHSLHGDKEIEIIPHGYDPEIMHDGRTKPTDDFTITYTGRIYEEMQDPAPFFAALLKFVGEPWVDRRKVKVRFYSDPDPWMRAFVEGHSLNDCVVFYDRLPKDQIVRKQRESQLLLVFGLNRIPHEKGCSTLKIFDYMASGRPVLAVGTPGDDVLSNLIDKAGVGYHVPDEIATYEILCRLYREYLNHGSVTYHGRGAIIRMYDHRVMAQRFATLLDQISR